MNRVILIGNLTRDPERRTTRSGVTTCNSSGARAGTTPPEGMTTTTPSRTKNNSRPPL